MPRQGFGTFSCVMLRSTITVNPCTQPEDGQALITRLTNQTACGDSVESGDRLREARSLTYVGPVRSSSPSYCTFHAMGQFACREALIDVTDALTDPQIQLSSATPLISHTHPTHSRRRITNLSPHSPSRQPAPNQDDESRRSPTIYPSRRPLRFSPHVPQLTSPRLYLLISASCSSSAAGWQLPYEQLPCISSVGQTTL